MGGQVIVLVSEIVKLPNTQKLGVVKKCFPKQGEVLVEWANGSSTIERAGSLEVQR